MYKDFLSGMNTHPHTEDQWLVESHDNIGEPSSKKRGIQSSRIRIGEIR